MDAMNMLAYFYFYVARLKDIRVLRANSVTNVEEQ